MTNVTLEQLSMFRGRPDVYADESEGFFKPVRGNLSEAHLTGHLAGTQGPYGVYLMDCEDMVSVICWDLDDHENSDQQYNLIVQQAKELFQRLCDAGFDPVIERSKGGRGYHVWVLFERPVHAWRVRLLAKHFTPDGAEFFPKQDHVREGGFGNLVRLPGCGQSQWMGGTEPVLTSTESFSEACTRLDIPVEEPERSGAEYEPQEGDARRAMAALRNIDPEHADDYHMWIKIGQALHSTDSDLFEAWDEWSQQSDKYDGTACVRKWETFYATPGGVGLGTLYHLAREFGWKDKPLDSVFISLGQAQNKASEMGPPMYIPTGIQPLDESVDGYSPGELVVVGGRPNHGKSIFGFSLLENAARQGYRGLMVSIEMSDVELARRAELHPLPDGVKDNIFIVEARPDLTEILRHIEAAVEELGVSVVCVDYAQLIRANNQGNRRLDVSDAAEALKQLCRDHGISIILLSQLKRAVSERDGDAIPRSSDLSESGGLENAADVIFLLWYNSKEDIEAPRDMYSIYITKRRNGQIRENIVTCTFYPEEQRYGGKWTIEGIV